MFVVENRDHRILSEVMFMFTFSVNCIRSSTLKFLAENQTATAASSADMLEASKDGIIGAFLRGGIVERVLSHSNNKLHDVVTLTDDGRRLAKLNDLFDSVFEAMLFFVGQYAEMALIHGTLSRLTTDVMYLGNGKYKSPQEARLNAVLAGKSEWLSKEFMQNELAFILHPVIRATGWPFEAIANIVRLSKIYPDNVVDALNKGISYVNITTEEKKGQDNAKIC